MRAPDLPRVLLLTETYHPEIGGGERQAGLLSAGLRRRGHKVLLLTRRSRPGLRREEVIDGLRVLRAGPVGPGRRRKWGLIFSVVPALVRLRAEYDVVLVSGFRILAIPALLVGRQYGKAVVLKADSSGEMSGEYFRSGLSSIGLAPDSWLVRRLLAARNSLFRRADAFVAMGCALYEEMAAAGVPTERIHVIPNGVDMDVYYPASSAEQQELRKSLELPPGPVAAYTGRLVTYKGLLTLLQAWRVLVEEGMPGTLVLVGEGGGDQHACEAHLMRFIAEHDLSTRVKLTGAVDNVSDWLRAADIFVFPTENEAFGLSLVEAMACGLPAVTTQVGGLRDFVVPGENALVVEPGDVPSLAAAMRRLFDDRERASRLGVAARAHVTARFGVAAMATGYGLLLEELAGSRRPTR